jgi:hypothetical protein
LLHKHIDYLNGDNTNNNELVGKHGNVPLTL